MKTITLDEWFVNAGVLGFKQVLDNYADSSMYRIEQFSLHFDPNVLEHFAENYFALMLDKYSKYKQDRLAVQKCLEYARNESYFKDQSVRIAKLVKTTWDKLKKSKIKVSDESLTKCEQIYMNLKEVKKVEQRDKLEELSKEYLQFLQIPEVHDLLTLNYIRFVLGNLFGMPSFLNPSFTGSLEDFIQRFHADYVIPVMEEIEFQNWIAEVDPTHYLDELKKRSRDKTLSVRQKELAKKALQHVEASGKLLSCAIQADWFGNIQFEEMMFSPLGLSLKVENSAWNGKHTILISSITRLLLFCSSIAFSFSQKKVSNANLTVEEYVDTYSFVNLDTKIQNLERANRDYVNKRDKENPYQELIFDLLKSTKDHASYALQNILFVEFSNDGKNSKLQYFHINKKLARFFKNDGDYLQKIKYQYFRNLVIEEMLKGRDPIFVIQHQLRKQIQKEKSAYDCYQAVKARHAYLIHTRGERSMEKKKVTNLYREGKKMARWFVDKEKQNQIQGVSYRLLNSCKSGNKQLFFDSLLRVYMTAGFRVPEEFLNIFHQKELDFEEVGYSFISGLQSLPNQLEEEDNNE